MELCPTLDMLGDYFTNALQVSQLHRFCNIIIDIHEDKILAYNKSGRALLEERKLKLKKQKEEDQKAAKITGDYANQGV